jgi:SEC-C motif-containing protein
MSALSSSPCPCGTGKKFADCCGRYLDGGEYAGDAERLMRSRYSAYTLRREDYLLVTWHASTRPPALHLDETDSQTRWLGLSVKRHDRDPLQPACAVVEFVARYKTGGGRAQRLHEISRFVREQDRWFYVDGEIANATG